MFRYNDTYLWFVKLDIDEKLFAEEDQFYEQ